MDKVNAKAVAGDEELSKEVGGKGSGKIGTKIKAAEGQEAPAEGE